MAITWYGDQSTLEACHFGTLVVLRHTLKDDTSQQEIDCRVIFVFSAADRKIARTQRQKQINGIRTGLEKTKKNVDGGAF